MSKKMSLLNYNKKRIYEDGTVLLKTQKILKDSKLGYKTKVNEFIPIDQELIMNFESIQNFVDKFRFLILKMSHDPCHFYLAKF